jgi:hypothetical protein
LLRNAKDRAPLKATSTSQTNSTAGKRRSRSLKAPAKSAVRDDSPKEKPDPLLWNAKDRALGSERIYFYAEKMNMAEPTKEELLARIAELEKQAGGSKRSGTLEFRVGEKGGVSVYGLGRFPVTLYYEQWVRLLDATDGLRAFLEENKHRLKLKTKE